MITNLFNRILKLMTALIMGIVLFGGAMWALPAMADGPVFRRLSPQGVGAPDIEASSDGSMVALVYYKRRGSDPGGVYLKSADAVNGWRTRPNALGFTRQAPRLAFSSTTTSTVYAVWIDGDATSVKYARCTLSTDTVPDCPETGTVYETTNQLNTPDIAIGNNHNIHLAWANADLNNIQTVLIKSTQDLPLTDTDITPLNPGDDEKFLLPRLAADGNRVHLAYLRDSTIGFGGPQGVVYKYSNGTSSHSWTTPSGATGGVFDIGGGKEINPDFEELGNVAIAAFNDTRVQIAWDAWDDNPLVRKFSLIGAQSENNGVDWVAKYITSTQQAALATAAGDARISRFGTGVNPVEAVGLRPSVVMSDTGFAVTWQQRPDESGCGTSEGGTQNESSEIYAAYTNTTSSLAESIVTENAFNKYAIAPDMAVAGSVRHVAFMQYVSSVENCASGVASDYAIYYTGPFDIISNDQGEGGVFLPIILKNS